MTAINWVSSAISISFDTYWKIPMQTQHNMRGEETYAITFLRKALGMRIKGFRSTRRRLVLWCKLTFWWWIIIAKGNTFRFAMTENRNKQLLIYKGRFDGLLLWIYVFFVICCITPFVLFHRICCGLIAEFCAFISW